MNRFDEIWAKARDIASHVHNDPILRNNLADELITLCGLMIQAVGKCVAAEGESSMNDQDDDTAFGRYLVGERMQGEAKHVMDHAVGADLERYDRPVWKHTDMRPAEFRANGSADNHRCPECGRVERFGHWHNCSSNDRNA